MLPELLAWFTGKDVNKRKYPRKRRPYRASYTLDGKTQRTAIGLDMSGGGCCILTQEMVPAKEFDLRAQIDERIVKLRARIVWQDTVNHQGRKVWRYGMQFTGIPADDWDAIIRYTNDKAPVDAVNKAQEDLTKVRMTPDDTARLLPTALQNRLLMMLVQRGRLAPLDDKPALVQYFYAGITRYDGKPMHRLTIQSKVFGPDDQPETFETEFVFDDSGQNVGILERPTGPPPPTKP